MPHKFLVHAKRDSVGVAVDDIHPGEKVEGVVLEDDSIVTLKAADTIPLGHKIALTHLAAGAGVLKYGEQIGQTTAAIEPGRWVHVHNLKSARW